MSTTRTPGTWPIAIVVLLLLLCIVSAVTSAIAYGIRTLDSGNTTRYSMELEQQKFVISATATAVADAREERTMYAVKDAYKEGRDDGEGKSMLYLAAALAVLTGGVYAVNLLITKGGR